MYGYGAQQALAAQTGETSPSSAVSAQLIAAIRSKLPQVEQALRQAGYPRHAYASFRADMVWYGDPPRQLYAWRREIGVGFADYGYTKVPVRSQGVAILIDESNAIKIINTPDAGNVAYGDCDLEELKPTQLQAILIICDQLCGPPKTPTWNITPLDGHDD